MGQNVDDLVLDMIRIDRNIVRMVNKGDSVGIEISGFANEVLKGTNMSVGIGRALGVTDETAVFDVLETCIEEGRTPEETLAALKEM